MEAQGDVDGPFFHKTLQVGDLGTLEDGLGGTVTHVDPAHRVLHVVEVHGRGLLGAGGGDVGHGGSAQVRGQNVLGVGNEQHRRAIHRLWGQGGNKGVRAHLSQGCNLKEEPDVERPGQGCGVQGCPEAPRCPC